MRLLRRTFTPREFRFVAYAALAVCTLIVFTGAAVRLTGSGLGCPDWPRCDGTSLTPELHTHGLIEFGNRVMTSVVAIPCLLAVWMAWRRRPFRRDLLLLAALLPFGVAAQAVWGGFTVIYDLAPGWVIVHFLLSMLLLVACVALVLARDLRARRAAAEHRPPEHLGRATAAAPGLRDADRRDDRHRRRARTRAARARATTSSGSPGRARTRSTGRSTATRRLATFLGLACVGVWFLVRWRREGRPATQNAMTAVCVLLACQGFVGATQYALELPAEIVWFHVVLSALTWVALLVATAAAGRRRAPARRPHHRNHRSRRASSPARSRSVGARVSGARVARVLRTAQHRGGRGGDLGTAVTRLPQFRCGRPCSSLAGLPRNDQMHTRSF